MSDQHPLQVETSDEVYTTHGGVDLLARVHRPVGVVGAPVLVDAHGGAWRHFDRTVDDHPGRGLAARGIAVVAVDFRQAPNNRWPDPVDDLLAALAWVRAEADRLGVDPGRMGLMGGSSGGHLAMSAAIAATRREPLDVRPRVVVALWPVADPLARYRYLESPPDDGPDEPLFDPPRLRRAQDQFFGDLDTMHAASVAEQLRGVAPGTVPPLWLAHPEHDRNITRAMSDQAVDAWRAAGGDAELALFAGVGHSFVNFGGPDADRCLDQIAAVVEQHLTSATMTTEGRP